MTSGSTDPEGQTTILLGIRYSLTREGIAHIIRDGGFQVVGEVNTLESLYQLAGQHSPDIVLLDWDLAENPHEVVRVLAKEKLPTGIVVLISLTQAPESILDAIQAGATGCLSFNLTGEEFVARLRMLARGDLVISQELAPGLEEQLASKDSGETRDDLSQREKEVLTLVSHGATNREIAERLTITENTVKVHLRHILEKLDLRNRQQAAAFAVREGLVETTEPIDIEDLPG